MKRAYWDVIKEKLIAGWADGSGFESVIDILDELLSKMGGFMKRNPKKQEEFLAKLDMKMIRQMVQHRAYDINAFIVTIKQLVGMLYDLESPFQHARTNEFFSDETFYGEILKLTTPEEYAKKIVDALTELFRKVDVCQQELDNFYISILPQEKKEENETQQFFNVLMPKIKYLGQDMAFVKALQSMNAQKFNSSQDLYDWFISKEILFSPRPLQDHEVIVPMRVELKDLHAIQNMLQSCCIIGVL